MLDSLVPRTALLVALLADLLDGGDGGSKVAPVEAPAR